jgi:hypothetical protein
MSSITINVQAETERMLKEWADQGGQTVAAYLESFVEQQVHRGNGTLTPHSENADDELDERPWRGVFVLPKRRDILCSRELNSQSEQLPRRQPSPNMSWHRAVTDDE